MQGIKMRKKTKEFTYNYVDRIRLAENSLQDYKCPTRGTGWRHTRSISHLDLATSCRGAASGLSHWPNQRQLRHTRSLDYNERCQDNLDEIAEFYWRIDPKAEFYEQNDNTAALQSSAVIITEPKSNNGHNEGHYHCRSYNYADEKHHSAESIHYQQQQQQHQQQRSSVAAALQALEYDGEACSLRRSRSLAVIREETFSDLQITSANSSRRRSQLIPRARLVNRGFLQERERFCCGNNKHHHNHHYFNGIAREDQTSNNNINIEQDNHSIGSTEGATTCDSHQNQCENQHHNHSNQIHTHISHHHTHQHQHQTFETATKQTENFYHNLKSLDAVTASSAYDREQFHAWHNDKSDLESLNSDYFKNSLHQNNEFNKKNVDFEALEQAVHLLTQEKPRIYQSRRNNQQPRSHIAERKYAKSDFLINGADSCPENSQSSIFPETTTSNSDNDQTDSLSLSEQEYDLTKIEEIFEKAELENDDESFELISLTTTRTHYDYNTDEDEEQQQIENNKLNGSITHSELSYECGNTSKLTKAVSENSEKLIAYDSVYLSSEEGSEATLVNNNNCDFYDTSETGTLLQISIEDAVYEAIDKNKEVIKSQELVTKTINNNNKQIAFESDNLDKSDKKNISETPIYTQVLKVEHKQQQQASILPTSGVTSSAASKPNILSVVEKRKLKRYTTEIALPTDLSATLGTLEHIPQLNSNAHNCQHLQKYNHLAPLQRQATDSLYFPYIPKPNLGGNQYHSLPDVNIGQSLKVSECIDAELRSSYNYKCYPETQRRETDQVSTTTTTSDNRNKQRKQPHDETEIVTKEEIYDSIKRFGRAHQKARQHEYQELLNETAVNVQEDNRRQETNEQQTQQAQQTGSAINETLINETSKKPATITTKIRPSENVSSTEFENIVTTTNGSKREESTEPLTEVTLTTPTQATQPTQTTSTALINTTEIYNEEDIDVKQLDCIEQSSTNTVHELNGVASELHHTYEEQAKDAPNIEVANFSKQIQQRAVEIREWNAEKVKRNQIYEIASASTYSSANFLSNSSKIQQPNVNAEAPCDLSITNQFRIIVNETQDNIIEEDSIDGNFGESLIEAETLSTSDTKKKYFMQKETKNLKTPKSKENNKKKLSLVAGNSLKRIPSKSRRQLQHQQAHICQHHQHHQQSNATIELASEQFNQFTTNNHTRCHQSQQLSYPKSKEHRVLTTQIYKARPIRVLAANESFRNMSRPQILHVIENKRKANLVTNSNDANEISSNQVENEYFKKVDAVRCYWSKLAKDEEIKQKQQAPNEEHSNRPQTPQQQHNEQKKQPERKHFIIGEHEECAPNLAPATATTTSSAPNPDEFCSFMPSIEIVELGGNKKATIVSAIPSTASSIDHDRLSNDGSASPQFDHIRYKVLKSQQLLRSNMTPRTKKEAQFDGLIQYLQDYSFQELLSNNNVVIVEPVRTKIEPPKTRTARSQDRIEKWKNTPSMSPVTNTASVSTANIINRNSKKSMGIRRHFFYQPVRVNRELYEEELPNPDTVRNVRKFFEEHILPQPGHGLLLRDINKLKTNDNNEPMEKLPSKPEPKPRRERKYRHLTIDTSYGHTLKHEQQQQQEQQQQHSTAHARGKWDTASLSSGISSGDLSSPCECNDANNANTKITLTSTSEKSNAMTISAPIAPIAVVRPQEVRSVHVQDVVRRHNSNQKDQQNSSDATSRFSGSSICNKTRALPHPHPRRSTVTYGSSENNEINHGFYENRSSNATQRHHEFMDYKKRDDTINNENNKKPHRKYSYINVDEDIFVEDNNEANEGSEDDYDDDNDIDDIGESHYVSNEVLEKIRECGSSVTYYGGHVLHAGSPEFQRVSSPTCCNGVLQEHNVKQFGRNRAQQSIVTSRVCQPNKCPYNCELKEKFKKHETKHIDSNTKEVNGDGIKFKLVKSNSCNSRLELAGANDDEHSEQKQSEMVRRMVNQYECKNSKKHNVQEEHVTINNQSTTQTEEIGSNLEKTIITQKEHHSVTVNNHINVPQQQQQAKMINNGANEKMTVDNRSTAIHRGAIQAKSEHIEMANKKEMCDAIAKQAQLAIHLVKHITNEVQQENNNDEEENNNNNNNDGLNSISNENTYGDNVNSSAKRKISRNKNVDLAFTLVKKQQQQPTTINSKPCGTLKDKEKITTQQQSLNKNEHEIVRGSTLSVVINGMKNFQSNSIADDTADNNTTVSKNRQLSPETHSYNEHVKNNVRATTMTTTASTVIQKNPPQIIVPVQIHSSSPQQRIESVEHKHQALASTCNIDQNVVRHYVANDRSLFEKRKYDDIQFEEFEVYDPSKGFEQQKNESKNSIAIDRQTHEEYDETCSNFSTIKDANINVEYDEEEYDDSVDDTYVAMETKSKSETDCYDSLDDKL